MPFVLSRVVPLLCLVLLIGLAAPSVHAQQPSPPRTITFDEAIRIALRENIQLRQTAANVRAADYAVDFARASFLPNLNASLQPVRRYGLTFDQTTGQLQQQTSDAMSGGISSQLTLFNGFQNVAELRRRQHERRAGALTLERTRDDVVFTVASQYLQLLLDDEIMRIRAEALEAQRLQLARIGQLVEAGVRPRTDMLQQEALVAEAELALLQAENQHQLAQTRLVRTLQLDPFDEYDFVAQPLEEAEIRSEPLDLGALLEAALDRRSDVRAQEIQIAAAEEGVRVARSGYYPTVTAFGQLGSSYSSLTRREIGVQHIPLTTASGETVLVGNQPFTIASRQFEFTPFGDQFFTDNRSGAIGVAVQLPVFDRLLTRAQVAQAQISLENQRLAREDLRHEVATQVRQALLDYRNAEMRLEVTARQVAAARAALAAEEDRYELGVSTLAELAQARARVVEAESARAQALAQAAFQRRSLEYAAGLLVPQVDLYD
jgi:outer membrane protein